MKQTKNREFVDRSLKYRKTDFPIRKYENVVSMLKELLTETEEDVIQRAFAEAVYENRVKNNAKKAGGKIIGSSVCPERLAGRPCNERRGRIHDFDYKTCERIPGADHTVQYVKDRKVVAIITEPYGLSFGTLVELIEFCQQRGLEAEIDAASSHFPSQTLRVILKKAGTTNADPS